jgi:hypothetical protein
VSFYRSANLKWEMDDGLSTHELLHGHQYTFNDMKWVFIENEPIEDTYDHQQLFSKAKFHCYLSPDEESVEVKIIINELELSLGEKVYNYLLLLLARRRLEDKSKGFKSEEQGWAFVNQLLQELSRELLQDIDVYYFNVMIHRFRSHLKSIKPYGHLFANIIERQRGKVRLHHPNIKIFKNQQEIKITS